MEQAVPVSWNKVLSTQGWMKADMLLSHYVWLLPALLGSFPHSQPWPGAAAIPFADNSSDAWPWYTWGPAFSFFLLDLCNSPFTSLPVQTVSLKGEKRNSAHEGCWYWFSLCSWRSSHTVNSPAGKKKMLDCIMLIYVKAGSSHIFTKTFLCIHKWEQGRPNSKNCSEF